jgi:hypothetical protein
VVLEDVEVEVFNVFVHWLYAQSLPTSTFDLTRIAEAEHWAHPPAMVLLKSCIFGDRFLAPAFHQLVHNHFVDKNKAGGGIRYAFIKCAFENLPEDDPILTLMIDLQCTRWTAANDTPAETNMLSELPHKFLLGVMFKYEKLRVEAKVKLCILDGCSYHRHASEEERMKCQAGN